MSTLPRPPASQLETIVAIEAALEPLETNPLAGVRILPPQAISGVADTRVFHGLGQRPRGYFVVGSAAAGTVFDGVVPESADPRNFITLRGSAVGMNAVVLAVF